MGWEPAPTPTKCAQSAAAGAAANVQLLGAGIGLPKQMQQPIFFERLFHERSTL